MTSILCKKKLVRAIICFLTDQPSISLVALNRETYTLNSKEIFSTYVNDSVTLFCAVSGYPQPTSIRWFKNNVDITTNTPKFNESVIDNTYDFNRTSAIKIDPIEEVENGNEYRCESTSAGFSTSSKTIRVLVCKFYFSIFFIFFIFYFNSVRFFNRIQKEQTV